MQQNGGKILYQMISKIFFFEEETVHLGKYFDKPLQSWQEIPTENRLKEKNIPSLILQN